MSEGCFPWVANGGGDGYEESGISIGDRSAFDTLVCNPDAGPDDFASRLAMHPSRQQKANFNNTKISFQIDGHRKSHLIEFTPLASTKEGFNALVSASGLDLPDKRVDPDSWLRSGFEFPQRQLGLNLLLDPISCGCYTVEQR